MAGRKLIINGSVCMIDYHDGEGSAIVNGRKWRWEFHHYCGPTFLRKDGEPRRKIPSESHPVWDAFGKWLKIYHERRKTAKSHEIVSVSEPIRLESP